MKVGYVKHREVIKQDEAKSANFVKHNAVSTSSAITPKEAPKAASKSSNTQEKLRPHFGQLKTIALRKQFQLNNKPDDAELAIEIKVTQPPPNKFYDPKYEHSSSSLNTAIPSLLQKNIAIRFPAQPQMPSHNVNLEIDHVMQHALIDHRFFVAKSRMIDQAWISHLVHLKRKKAEALRIHLRDEDIKKAQKNFGEKLHEHQELLHRKHYLLRMKDIEKEIHDFRKNVQIDLQHHLKNRNYLKDAKKLAFHHHLDKLKENTGFFLDFLIFVRHGLARREERAKEKRAILNQSITSALPHFMETNHEEFRSTASIEITQAVKTIQVDMMYNYAVAGFSKRKTERSFQVETFVVTIRNLAKTRDKELLLKAKKKQQDKDNGA